MISRDSLPAPRNIYGMGLTYSQHLQETAATFDPDVPPPIFKKSLNSLSFDGEKVKIPGNLAFFLGFPVRFFEWDKA